MSPDRKNVAIIGAGLAGLTLAHYLHSEYDCHIFEKSRGVGGRLATRYADPYFFDHGAQYFKAKSKEFLSFLDPLVKNNVVKSWNARFREYRASTYNDLRTWGDDYAHFVGVPGMNEIGKYLAKNQHVFLNKKIKSAAKGDDKWVLSTESGDVYGYYDWLVFAIPSPQVKEIIPKSFIFYDRLSMYKMNACFSLMLGFTQDLNLPFDAAIVKEANISWISVNSNKPKRYGSYSLLIHSTNDWADSHFDDDRLKIKEYLIKESSRVLNHNLSEFNHAAVHGWRYANCNKQDKEITMLDTDNKLGVCGDWLIHGRVEAAFLSAYKLARQLLNAKT